MLREGRVMRRIREYKSRREGRFPSREKYLRRGEGGGSNNPTNPQDFKMFTSFLGKLFGEKEGMSLK